MAVALHDARKFVLFLDIILGAIGAMVAGFVADTFTLQNVAGLYDETILLAVIGAGLLIWLGRTIVIKNTI